MKTKLLEILSCSEDFISGEDISRELQVTRAAVWKTIKSLREDGYNIVSRKHYGYRLEPGSDVLNIREIVSVLAAVNQSGFLDIHYYDEIDSTNLAARRDIDSLKGWSVYVADRQLAGRGRLGRSWQSDPGCGLWLSVMLRPRLEPQFLASLTLFAGLCVQRALVRLSGLDIGIKWPNDLVVMPQGQKICGILTETVLEDLQVRAVIIGIGINVNTETFAGVLGKSATSLKLSAGHGFSRLEVLKAVVEELVAKYPDYETLTEKNRWLDEYRSACVSIGRAVVIHNSDQSTETGMAENLSEDGDLLVRLSDGSLRRCHAGEVSVRGLAGYI